MFDLCRLGVGRKIKNPERADKSSNLDQTTVDEIHTLIKIDGLNAILQIKSSIPQNEQLFQQFFVM